MAVMALMGGCQVFDRPAPSAGTPAPGQATQREATVDARHTGRPAAVVAARPEAPAGAVSATRGRLLAAQGREGEALREFERAIAENPRLTIAYMGAADIYRERGEYDRAEPYYAQAAKLEPRNFDAQYLHGLTLQLMDRLSEAVRAYLRALEIQPGDFNANLNVATAYIQLGEPGEGLAYAQRAVELRPKDASARINLGAIYASLDRHDDAIVEYQQAAELAPLTGPLLLSLADSLGRVGRFEEMANTLAQLIRTEPTADAHERLGSALFRLRRYDESLAAFRKALEIDPNNFPALNGVGVNLLNQWVWSDQSDEAARREALSALKRSLVIEPNQPWIIDLIAKYQ